MSVLVLLGFFSAWLSSQLGQGPVPESAPPSDDYAVYSEVLESHFVKSGVEHLVIGDQTLMDFPPVMAAYTEFGGSRDVKKLHRATSKETGTDYEAKNKDRVALENKFSVAIPVVLLTAAERDAIFSQTTDKTPPQVDPHSFDKLNRLYPHAQGFMHLSRVGFNLSHTQALVYAGNVCGRVCGTGEYFLLVKDATGHWKIKYIAMTWIS